MRQYIFIYMRKKVLLEQPEKKPKPAAKVFLINFKKGGILFGRNENMLALGSQDKKKTYKLSTMHNLILLL